VAPEQPDLERQLQLQRALTEEVKNTERAYRALQRMAPVGVELERYRNPHDRTSQYDRLDRKDPAVTSVAGYVPNPGESAYGASKAALSRWSHGLAIDLHDTGVHVGVLSPGPIDTEIWSLDEELSYTGKLYPPEVVADGVARMIEHRLVHLTVPRHYGLVGALYPILGRPMRWGLRRYAVAADKKLGGTTSSAVPAPKE